MASPASAQPIDLSGGLIPKTPTPPKTQSQTDSGVDLSAGFVPKTPPPAPSESTYDPGQMRDSITQPMVSAITDNPVARFVKGAGSELEGAYEGAKSLFTGPQNPTEEKIKSSVGDTPGGPILGQVGVDAYRAGKGMYDSLAAAKAARDREESIPGKILATAENYPIIGDVVKKIEGGDVAGAVGTALTRATLMKGGPGEVENPVTDATMPITKKIGDTELPLTFGQARAESIPEGGTILRPLENLTANLPGGKGLKEIGEGQQAGAREVLAGKAAKTGADVSPHPEAIEQNYANAVQRLREEGNARYQAIGEAAAHADFSEPTSVAADILSDPDLSKALPKSARDALGKVSSSLTEQDGIARQIYGRPFSDLEDAQKLEVGKAMHSGPEPAGMQAILKARSELADVASTSNDAATRYRAGKALDSFDEAVGKSLAAHDKVNGSHLVDDLRQAKQVWSQKYAYDTFRKGLQQIMRSAPSQGDRVINGQTFQRMVNKLDPQGGLAGRTSPLQRMFPGDPQSVADMHNLADFMGKYQGSSGSGFSGMMARMRILGLKQSAVGLLTNAAGFSWLMSHPGAARVVLTGLKAGKDAAKLSTAVGELNHLAVDAPGAQNHDTTLAPAVNGQDSTATTATANLTPSPISSATPNSPAKKSAIPNAMSTTTNIPPASLWNGKEGKRLTVQGPDGKQHKWVLRSGQPMLAE